MPWTVIHQNHLRTCLNRLLGLTSKTSDSADLEWDPRICMSNFSGGIDAASLGNTQRTTAQTTQKFSDMRLTKVCKAPDCPALIVSHGTITGVNQHDVL